MEPGPARCRSPWGTTGSRKGRPSARDDLEPFVPRTNGRATAKESRQKRVFSGWSRVVNLPTPPPRRTTLSPWSLSGGVRCTRSCEYRKPGSRPNGIARLTRIAKYEGESTLRSSNYNAVRANMRTRNNNTDFRVVLCYPGIWKVKNTGLHAADIAASELAVLRKMEFCV